jgi:hypothetical protein
MAIIKKKDFSDDFSILGKTVLIIRFSIDVNAPMQRLR